MTTVEARYAIVSSDCHAGASILDYKPYLERRWHEEFDAWAAAFADPWLEVDRAPISSDGPGDEGRRAGTASGPLVANWDDAVRVRDLERDGIAGEVVFPNTAPPFFPSGVLTASTPRTRDEYARRWAGLRAHNRWLVDFCSLLPGRRAGIAQILLNDVDDAVSEIAWAREAGLTGGVLVPLVEQNGPIPPLFTDAYERVWSACVDCDVPANQHSGGSGMYQDHALSPAGLATVVMEMRWTTNRTLWHLILGGVFERHARLRFVMTEQGAAWIPECLDALDALATNGVAEGSFLRQFLSPAMSALSMTPTDYFRRNCWVGASFMGRDEVVTGVVDRIGTGLMWGSDYPHGEGTFPRTRDFVSAAFFDRSVAENRRLLGETAIDVYQFDVDAVRTAAARVGPTVERIGEGPAPLDPNPFVRRS